MKSFFFNNKINYFFKCKVGYLSVQSYIVYIDEKMINPIENIDTLIIKQILNDISLQEKNLLFEWINENKKNQKYFIEAVKIFEQSTIHYQHNDNIEIRYVIFENLLKKKNRIKYIKLISSIAAVSVFCIVTSFFILTKQPKDLIVKTLNEKKTITLPDSSIVWLNSNSTIKYNSKFRKERKIDLVGEAYFEVKKDVERPFIVKTDNLQINVLGTKFIVTDYKTSSTAETVLKCGSINLLVNNSKDKLLVRKDQKVSFIKKTRQLSVEIVNTDNYTNWRKDKLVFENTKLRDVFIQMEKWYNIGIECKSEKINSIPLSFIIEKEPLENILNTLQMIVPISWSKNNNNDEFGREMIIIVNKN